MLKPCQRLKTSMTRPRTIFRRLQFCRSLTYWSACLNRSGSEALGMSVAWQR